MGGCDLCLIFRLIGLVCGIFLITGASLFASDVIVVDVKTGKINHLDSKGNRRIVLKTKIDSTQLITGESLGSGGLFSVRQVDLESLKSKKIACFMFKYGYLSRWAYDFSTGIDRVVYARDHSGDLSLLNLQNKIDKVLLKGVAGVGDLNISMVRWISSSEFMLISADSDGDLVRNINVISSESAQKKLLDRIPMQPLGGVSVSESGKWLACVEAQPSGLPGETLRIYDLSRFTITAKIPSEGSLPRLLKWNGNDSELVFVSGNTINRWKVGDKRSHPLIVVKKNITIDGLFVSDKYVGYITREAPWSFGNLFKNKRQLILVDRTNGKQIFSIVDEFNGEIFSAGKGRYIVAEVGY